MKILTVAFIIAVCSSQQPSLYLAYPTIFVDKGKYYLYGTGDPNGFKVYISDDFKTWKLSGEHEGFALKKGESFGDKGFWAPQIFQHAGKYYMVYTVNENI